MRDGGGDDGLRLPPAHQLLDPGQVEPVVQEHLGRVSLRDQARHDVAERRVEACMEEPGLGVERLDRGRAEAEAATRPPEVVEVHPQAKRTHDERAVQVDGEPLGGVEARALA